jgi:hypothetical protein
VLDERRPPRVRESGGRTGRERVNAVGAKLL